MINKHDKQVFDLLCKMFQENRIDFQVSDVFDDTLSDDSPNYGFTLTSTDERFSIFLHNDGTFSIADWDWENGKINY